MGVAGRPQRRPSGIPTGLHAILDPAPFHVGQLGEHGQNEFGDWTVQGSDPVNMDADTSFGELPDGGLDIERVTTEPINGVDVEYVSSPSLFEEFGEPRTISAERGAADPLILEFTVERTAHPMALRLDGLVRCGHPIVGEAHGSILNPNDPGSQHIAK